MRYQDRQFIDLAHTPPRLIGPGHIINVHPYTVIRTKGTADWLIFYTVRGNGRFGHSKEELISKPGDLMLYPPSTPHDYRIAPHSKEWEIQWAHFIAWPHWQQLLNWPQRFHGLRYMHIAGRAVQKRIVENMTDMNKFAFGPLQQGELFAMNSLEKVLLLCTTYHSQSQQMSIDSRIQKALAYICDHASEKITIKDIASHSALSESRLSHLFRAQTGMTPLHYLEFQRIRQAKQLLELSALSITQIAYNTGFESQAYFTRRFTKQTGISPRAYRRQYQEKAQ
jgi:AraC family transcriptional regulator of arabinose operon